MTRDRLNAWADLDYFDPMEILRAVYQDGFKHVFASRVASSPPFAPREFKRMGEALDAAVFASGLAARIPDSVVHLTEFEAQDHDFVLRFVVAGQAYFCPLQLKQLVSAETNFEATAEALLASFTKYADAADLVVAIKIDRLGVDPRLLRIPSLAVAELWFFGPLHQNSDCWYLYGNCLGRPEWFEFMPPT